MDVLVVGEPLDEFLSIRSCGDIQIISVYGATEIVRWSYP
jgi:hypothetical protein